jgi:hypothetical protein
MMQMHENAVVMTCLAEDCSYNCRDECCAPSIDIGDDHPRAARRGVVYEAPCPVLPSIAFSRP